MHSTPIESGAPLAPGQLKEIEKRRERQQALHDQHASVFPQLTNGLLEIGCGHGHWLTSYAEAHPQQFCVGVDLINRRIQKSATKADKRRLDNICFIKAEAIEWLEVVPDGIGIARVMVLFPDPWPKKRHHRRRLIQPSFLRLLARKMAKGGQLFFRTDHAPYFEWTLEALTQAPHWQIDRELHWPFEQSTYFQELMGKHQSVSATVQKLPEPLDPKPENPPPVPTPRNPPDSAQKSALRD